MEPHRSQAWALPNLDRNPAVQSNFYPNNIASNSSPQIVTSKSQFIHENCIERDAIIINSIATTSSIIGASDSELTQNYDNIIHENPQIITIHEHNEIITVKDDQLQDIQNTSLVDTGNEEMIVDENGIQQPYLQNNVLQEQIIPNQVEIVELNDENQISELKNQIVHEEQEESLDIVINNVVCCFSTRCHLNLKRIAQEGLNAIYKRDCGMVSMKIRNPAATASIWSSGKITVTGSVSEDLAHKSARRIARILQKLEFRIRFSNYSVVNVLGTCSLPFGIFIGKFSMKYRQESSSHDPMLISDWSLREFEYPQSFKPIKYEPELHPGCTFKIKNPKATLKLFSTGSVTVTAPSVKNVQLAISHVYPLCKEFSKPKIRVQPPTSAAAAAPPVYPTYLNCHPSIGANTGNAPKHKFVARNRHSGYIGEFSDSESN